MIPRSARIMNVRINENPFKLEGEAEIPRLLITKT